MCVYLKREPLQNSCCGENLTLIPGYMFYPAETVEEQPTLKLGRAVIALILQLGGLRRQLPAAFFKKIRRGNGVLG